MRNQIIFWNFFKISTVLSYRNSLKSLIATKLRYKMRIDVHCHAVGKGKNIEDIENKVYFNINDEPNWFTRRFYNFLYNDILERELIKLGADTDDNDGWISTDEYFDFVYRLLKDSTEIDGIVLLAFDAVYTNDGEVDEIPTDIWVSNHFLNEKVIELN